ncbi:MAG: hypothetical protein Q9207_006502 [Kuettlingeria erythrocarpa]
MQGVGWFLRRAIALATVTLTVKEYIADGLTHIDIEQVATGGITSTENRTLDWALRDHTDKIFGAVRGKSRWVKLADVDDDKFLKEGFDDMEGEHVQSWVESKDGGWTANQAPTATDRVEVVAEAALPATPAQAVLQGGPQGIPLMHRQTLVLAPATPHPVHRTGIYSVRPNLSSTTTLARLLTSTKGMVDSLCALEHTCAQMVSGQKTCIHACTTEGDIVNYIPVGTPGDVQGDAGPSKLSMHFMVLLPKYYKPVDLQTDKAYHAALVITKNPIGPNTLVAPQPGSDSYRGNNIPYLQTLAFDAHSERRAMRINDEVEKKWQWKENTSIGYHIKIVHQDNLHAVIFPDHPTLGLRLSDGGFEQVLSHLGEEDDELELRREVRRVEYWGKADTGCKVSKSFRHFAGDSLTGCKARRDGCKR